jgi:putative nucleotidyltransferase with HDIG domain
MDSAMAFAGRYRPSNESNQPRELEKATMSGNRLVNQSLLKSESTKTWIHNRVVELIASESVIPSFSNAAMKLTSLLQKEDVSLAQLAVVLELDPGLATRCYRAAKSAAYGGHDINSIQDALLMIGINEVRRIALTIGVMNTFNHLRIKVDWDKFWTHSVLVGRLTERLTGGFRESSGMDYVAGLLHDVGKLIIQHYFPREFEQILIRSEERKCGHAHVERDVMGLDHAQISAAICDVLKMPHGIVLGIHAHHNPLLTSVINDSHGDKAMLACCISLADTMANIGNVNIAGHKDRKVTFDNLPEWLYLNEKFECRGLKLDLDDEIASATTDIAALA